MLSISQERKENYKREKGEFRKKGLARVGVMIMMGVFEVLKQGHNKILLRRSYYYILILNAFLLLN